MPSSSEFPPAPRTSASKLLQLMYISAARSRVAGSSSGWPYGGNDIQCVRGQAESLDHRLMYHGFLACCTCTLLLGFMSGLYAGCFRQRGSEAACQFATPFCTTPVELVVAHSQALILLVLGSLDLVAGGENSERERASNHSAVECIYSIPSFRGLSPGRR